MPFWICPLCDTKKVGSTRPRLDNIVRYCLDCSAETGVLVRRVCKTLEQKRTEKREQEKRRQKAQAERKKARKERTAKKREESQSERFFWEGVDLRVLWARMIQLPSVPTSLQERPPTFHVRCAARRVRTVGTAWCEQNHVQVVVFPGRSLTKVLDTMLHELAHVVDHVQLGQILRSHGPSFKRILGLLEGEWATLTAVSTQPVEHQSEAP